jgi:hypothetical protein
LIATGPRKHSDCYSGQYGVTVILCRLLQHLSHFLLCQVLRSCIFLSTGDDPDATHTFVRLEIRRAKSTLCVRTPNFVRPPEFNKELLYPIVHHLHHVVTHHLATINITDRNPDQGIPTEIPCIPSFTISTMYSLIILQASTSRTEIHIMESPLKFPTKISETLEVRRFLQLHGVHLPALTWGRHFA